MTESESFLNSLEASLSREDADDAGQETKEQWKQGLAGIISEKMEELSVLKKIKGPKPKGEEQWGRLLAAKQEVLDYLLDLVKMIDSLGGPLTEDHMNLRKPHSCIGLLSGLKWLGNLPRPIYQAAVSPSCVQSPTRKLDVLVTL